MFPLRKAKDAVERWILGARDVSRPSAPPASIPQIPPAPAPNNDEQRLRMFVEGLKTNAPDWLGSVRLISFDTIRARLGDRWPTLQSNVELLAEKVIRDELSGDDQYLNMGDAEFLIYFADATAEETRVRCLGIVEAIHTRLFGVEDPVKAASQRIAECHVVHTGNLALEWESAGYMDRVQADGQAPLKTLRGLFRHDAELVDKGEAAASAQMALDSIIARALQTQHRADLAPLMDRVRRIHRSIQLLAPAAVATGAVVVEQGGPQSVATASRERTEEPDSDATVPSALVKALQDGAHLTNILGGADHSHKSMLEELRKLQRARAQSAPWGHDPTLPPALQDAVKNSEHGPFEYGPVFRSVFCGKRIFQGIYRVRLQSAGRTGAVAATSNSTDHRHGGAAVEQQLLKHAIELLADRSVGGRFMLLVPVHVETLHSPLLLTRYSTILRAAELTAKRRLVIEIIGYRESDNTIGIRRAIDEFRAQCEAIFVTLSHADIAGIQEVAVECKRLGAHSIGVDVSDVSEAGIMNALTKVFAAGDRFAIPTYIKGIVSNAVLAKAVFGGANYVCAPVLRPSLPVPKDVNQASFDDLYCAI